MLWGHLRCSRVGDSHLCSSWSPGGLSPCPVSQLQETQACPLQWPHLTPRPGQDETHTRTVRYGEIVSQLGLYLLFCFGLFSLAALDREGHLY